MTRNLIAATVLVLLSSTTSIGADNPMLSWLKDYPQLFGNRGAFKFVTVSGEVIPHASWKLTGKVFIEVVKLDDNGQPIPDKKVIFEAPSVDHEAGTFCGLLEKKTVPDGMGGTKQVEFEGFGVGKWKLTAQAKAVRKMPPAGDPNTPVDLTLPWSFELDANNEPKK